MWFLPRLGPINFVGGRNIDGMMQPTMPRWRHHRRLGDGAIDHPTAFHFECWIDLATTSAVIAVAKLVLTNRFAIPPGPELSAEGLTVPPSEKPEKKGLHLGVLPFVPRRVQPNTNCVCA